MEPCRLFRKIAALFAVVVFVFAGLLVFGFLALLFVGDLPPCEKPAKRQIAADEPLYPVQIKGQWGFIDHTGAFVVPATYEIARSFHEGRAVVMAEKKAGVIDPTGRVIVPLAYDWVTDFSEGLAAARQNDMNSVIDQQGRVVIAPRPWRVMPFNGGLALVTIDGPHETYAYINRTGKYVWGPHPYWRW